MSGHVFFEQWTKVVWVQASPQEICQSLAGAELRLRRDTRRALAPVFAFVTVAFVPMISTQGVSFMRSFTVLATIREQHIIFGSRAYGCSAAPRDLHRLRARGAAANVARRRFFVQRCNQSSFNGLFELVRLVAFITVLITVLFTVLFVRIIATSGLLASVVSHEHLPLYRILLQHLFIRVEAACQLIPLEDFAVVLVKGPILLLMLLL